MRCEIRENLDAKTLHNRNFKYFVIKRTMNGLNTNILWLESVACGGMQCGWYCNSGSLWWLTVNREKKSNSKLNFAHFKFSNRITLISADDLHNLSEFHISELKSETTHSVSWEIPFASNTLSMIQYHLYADVYPDCTIYISYANSQWVLITQVVRNTSQTHCTVEYFLYTLI